jgi:uncharacterized protein
MTYSIIRRSLIFPGSQSQGEYKQLPPPYQASVVPLITDSGYQISLLHGASTAEQNDSFQVRSQYYLLYFYGNGMCLLNSIYEFDYFQELGLNATVSEYIGFGLSSGEATEAGCEETARAAYQYLVKTKGIPPERILVGGWSLGAAVAIYLAKIKEVAGLIVLSPFTNLPAEAAQLFPLLAPFSSTRLVELAISERFDSLNRISHIQCPIFIGHGTEDDLVPFHMGQMLSETAKAQGKTVRFFPIEGASHNDVFEVGGKRLREAMTQFVDDLSGNQSH